MQNNSYEKKAKERTSKCLYRGQMANWQINSNSPTLKGTGQVV
jgi:hypothetical protein